MTAATRSPRYFVLVVDGLPLTQPGTADVPAIFHEEHEAVAAGQGLQAEGNARTVVLEAYADDYSFVGGRRVERPAVLELRPAAR